MVDMETKIMDTRMLIIDDQDANAEFWARLCKKHRCTARKVVAANAAILIDTLGELLANEFLDGTILDISLQADHYGGIRVWKSAMGKGQGSCP